ncbi:hypothetical protein BGX27_001793, partial [Mortierella sp. AM989]
MRATTTLLLSSALIALGVSRHKAKLARLIPQTATVSSFLLWLEAILLRMKILRLRSVTIPTLSSWPEDLPFWIRTFRPSGYWMNGLRSL